MPASNVLFDFENGGSPLPLFSRKIFKRCELGLDLGFAKSDLEDLGGSGTENQVLGRTSLALFKEIIGWM